jgi:diacylglycerol kinase family enzyme
LIRQLFCASHQRKKYSYCLQFSCRVGKATALSQRIIDELLKKDIHHALFKDDWPSAFNDFTDVWIVGGDGTLNYFINHYPEIELPLVIFGGGTGNDFHWLLTGNGFGRAVACCLRNKPGRSMWAMQ